MKYKAVFESFQKLHLQIYPSQFMTSQIIPLPFVLLCGKEGKKSQNLNVSRMKRAF